MWPFHKKRRVPESVAVSLVVSASGALHAGWISYFLSIKSQSFSSFVKLPGYPGVAGGLYLFVFSVFLILFTVGVVLLKGRDCGNFRDHVFWFFLASIVAFLILTIPGVLEFSLTPVVVK